jgi:hypothetical protein
MKRTSTPVTYSNVMSTVAVFLALGGGSVAVAGMVADDSVDSGSVVNDSLQSKDLRNEVAVKGQDVVDGELGSSDIATDGVGAAEIASSAVDSPEVAPDAITGAEISSSSVFSSDISDGTITGADIGDGQVDASEVGEGGIYRGDFEEITFDDDDAARNGDYEIGEVSADCATREGTGELLSADVKWDGPSTGVDADPEQFISEIKLNMATDTATVVGGTDTGAFSTLQISAVCLAY